MANSDMSKNHLDPAEAYQLDVKAQKATVGVQDSGLFMSASGAESRRLTNMKIVSRNKIS